MGRPRTNDDAVKDRLVQTATEMLATRPSESISVRALATAAGAATAAVYTLFGSKDALIGEVRSRAVSGLFAKMSSVPVSADPLADIYALAHAYRDWAVGHRHLYAVLFGGVQTFDPSGTAGTGDPVRPLLDAISRGLTTSALDGDPAAIALSLWVSLHGLVSLELAGALDGTTADHGFESALHAVLRGWSPRSCSPPHSTAGTDT
ncbi:TetR/AcrR family transcriptional regulator [Actinoplanes philippinensis]|uniref:TetR/AcrR family transcriptional regulator n=1 Tax=Actinoplanes philippinensis TaxID=35752 RepID=UPI0033E22748